MAQQIVYQLTEDMHNTLSIDIGEQIGILQQQLIPELKKLNDEILGEVDENGEGKLGILPSLEQRNNKILDDIEKFRRDFIVRYQKDLKSSKMRNEEYEKSLLVSLNEILNKQSDVVSNLSDLIEKSK